MQRRFDWLGLAGSCSQGKASSSRPCSACSAPSDGACCTASEDAALVAAAAAAADADDDDDDDNDDDDDDDDDDEKDDGSSVAAGAEGSASAITNSLARCGDSIRLCCNCISLCFGFCMSFPYSFRPLVDPPETFEPFVSLDPDATTADLVAPGLDCDTTGWS